MRVHRLVPALGLMAALAMGALHPASAQMVAAPPQILTLDQDRLYLDSQYGKALEARALVANQSLAAENRKIEADLAAEEAELTSKRPTMSAAAFQALADAFDAKVEQRRKDQSAKIEALKAQHDAGRKTFFQAVVPVLADMMRQMGAYALLNRDAVVLSFDAIDVTDRAIKAVDEKVGDGSDLREGPRLPELSDPVIGPTSTGQGSTGQSSTGQGSTGQSPTDHSPSGPVPGEDYLPGTPQPDAPVPQDPGAPDLGTQTPGVTLPNLPAPAAPEPLK